MAAHALLTKLKADDFTLANREECGLCLDERRRIALGARVMTVNVIARVAGSGS